MVNVKKSTIVEIIALLYVCLMLYTGISKLMDFTVSREQLSLMPLMEPISDTVAWLLPVGEIALAVILFIPRTRVIGLYLATALMVVFTLYVIYLIRYAPHLPCTCGGFLQALTWPQHLVFNIVFVLLGMWAIWLSRRPMVKEQETKVLYS